MRHINLRVLQFVGLLVFTLMLLLPTLATAEIDITDKVETIKGRMISDRLTGDALIDVSIKNISTETITGPVKVVVNISTAAVTLATADGQTAEGLTYILYDEAQGLLDHDFLSGQTSSSIRWRFTNPTRTRFAFTTTIFIPEQILDTDGDGVPDDQDSCPSDPAKALPGICGCGVADDANADGLADCGDNCRIWYADVDGDGYGDLLVWVTACADQLDGYVANPDDCDDTLWSVNPSSGERCDSQDTDCNNVIDDNCSVASCSALELDSLLPCLLECDGDTTCMGQCATGLSQECLASSVPLMSCLTSNSCIQSADIDPDCVASNCLSEWQSAMGTLLPPDTDLCPSDINKTEPGICGCGLADVDLNDDGVIDCTDKCPDDPNKLEPGTCGCGLPETDTDNDGTTDCIDLCPTDPDKSEPGTCGCGLEDDYDHDGQLDCLSECPVWYADRDADGYGDPTSYVNYCIQPDGYVANPDDCDDTLWSVNPAVGEICDLQDSNCNGEVDDGCVIAACSAIEINSLLPCVMECSENMEDCVTQCTNGVTDGCRSATIAMITCALDNSCTETTELDFACLSSFCSDQWQALTGSLVPVGTDLCPSDVNKTEPGICGCGLADEDSDGDGEYDCTDLCPTDPAKIEPGVCGCDQLDIDTDEDGLANCIDPDDDNDGYLDGEDCQPENPLVNPSTEEICDDLDNNCNGQVDENCAAAICTNTEIAAITGCADTCGGSVSCIATCLPDGFSSTCLLQGLLPLTQCLQSNSCGALDGPDVACIQENCSDQWVTVMGELPVECQTGETRSCGTDVGICQAGVETCTAEGLWNDVCVGEVASGSPSCNGFDNDCDGEVDFFALTPQWCTDEDGDGFIDNCIEECVPPEEGDWSAYEEGIITDCQPENPASYPGAFEICDGEDNNCDGFIDEDWPDYNADGIGDCPDNDLDNDGWSNGEDCSPNNGEIYPGRDEICDGLDNDCDGSVDEGFADLDSDGTADCMDGDIDGDGYLNDDDCQPNDPNSYPGAEEVCDAIDNNCDGTINENISDLDNDGEVDCLDSDIDGDGIINGIDCAPENPEYYYQQYWMLDKDRDGYSPDGYISACSPPSEDYVYFSGSGTAIYLNADCDDSDPEINNGAQEVCDGIDNNCNGSIDELFPDQDQDGVADCIDADIDGDGVINDQDCAPQDDAISPLATEICDDRDNNCDGINNEGFQDFDNDGLADCIDADIDGDGFENWDDCQPEDPSIYPDPFSEICDDGVDNNCDGFIDGADPQCLN